MESPTPDGAGSPARRGLLAVAAIVAAAAALATLALWALGVFDRDGEVEPAAIARSAVSVDGGDPFAFSDGERAELVGRATVGNSHVLYAKSPGGILASAKRTARWRDEIERAAGRSDIDPDVIEAMVLLESAGRPEVIAGDDPEAASGIGQILPSTGTDLLAMEVDLGRSQALTRQIARAEVEQASERGRTQRLEGRRQRRARAALAAAERREAELRRERAAADERFDPEAALAGMVRYLEIAEQRFGREDLAITSYHMGIGNLESVIDRYVGEGASDRETTELVESEDIDYTRLFFDSSPLRNPRAWALLGSLGDDSSTYLWRVLAAEQIMELWRSDRDELARLAELNGAKATAEEAFHPPGETEVFDDPDALAEALEEGELAPIPSGAEYGFRIDRRLGELAGELGADPDLYRALQPEALATLIYLSAKVEAISESGGSLRVTSAVRDAAYQDALVGVNPEATDAYSLHTTGYSFDILREYRNDAQAEAFQFMLDRLSALAVIDYAVEPRAIHITVSEAAEPLLDE